MNIFTSTSIQLSNSTGQITLDSEEQKLLAEKLSQMDVPELDTSYYSPARWMLLALRGEKIPAIKALRARRHLGLKEAKDIVEAFTDVAELGKLEADYVKRYSHIF